MPGVASVLGRSTKTLKKGMVLVRVQGGLVSVDVVRDDTHESQV
jgi:hypothetical protein